MRIELHGVLKAYRSLRALDHVTLTFEPGQIVGVLGANGAGKTTLLRCLAGLAVPDKGEILCDGQNFRRERLDLRRRLFFLPDFPLLFVELSVIRNISIILRLYERDDQKAATRVVQLLREFNVLHLALRQVISLSRGQLYKVGLVSLLAVDPEVWLLDEPFASGMDPQGIDAFRQYARTAAANGRTILYTTQILDLAERFSDRLCLIDHGEVRAFEPIATLRERAADKSNVLGEMLRRLRDSDP